MYIAAQQMRATGEDAQAGQSAHHNLAATHTSQDLRMEAPEK